MRDVGRGNVDQHHLVQRRTTEGAATMHWLERLGEPIASTRQAAEAFITAELERCVPKGWKITRVETRRLAWTIGPPLRKAAGYIHSDYGVRVPDSLDVIIFTHSNDDRGCFGLEQSILNALVVEAAALRHFGMAACLEYLMSLYRPNEWGYT
jgi:hypothetical protein